MTYQNKTNMKTYHITKSNFLDWYFEESYTEEQTSIREDLAEKVIQGLIENNSITVTVEEIFEQCNTSAIRCYLLEEFESDTDSFDDEIGYVEREDFIIILID